MKELNIYQKLALIRKQVEVMQKDEKAYGFNYIKEETLLAPISTFMEEYGLSLIPSIVPGTLAVAPHTYKKTKSTKQGAIYEENVNEAFVSCEMKFTWINNENPDERVVVPWAMVGQQADVSMAFGGGLTYATRYFLMKYFNIATSDDDPDAWRSKQKEAEEAAAKMVAGEVVKVIDETIRDYLREHKDSGAKIKELCSKYVKNGDYTLITDPILAQKLLDEFKSSFGQGG